MFLNDFLEQFFVVFNEFRNTLSNDIFGVALGHPEGDILKVLSYIVGTFVGIEFGGSSFRFCNGFVNGLTLGRRKLWIPFVLRHLVWKQKNLFIFSHDRE